MVSYYPPMPYPQKHNTANLAYPGQQWNWTTNYHTPSNHQFFNDVDSAHSHHQVYYSHMFHPQATSGTPSDWHSPSSAAENFSQHAASAHQMLQHHQHVSSLVGGSHTNNNNNNNNIGGSNSSASSGSSTTSSGPNSGNTQLNETNSSIGEQHIAEGLPSPPITVSGSEISSPGAPNSSSSPHHVSHHLNNNNNNNSPSTNNNNNNPHNNNNRTSPVKPQYYEWMKKPSYPAQPAPGKTRTKDKYRVVYTDYQRLELEKEYCTSRYITIRRKTELAQSLQLSERQVKIWFQNRRAKERKQNKKGSDPTMMSSAQHNDYLIDTKPKLDPMLQHSLHSMAIGMSPAMRLHHLHHGLPMGASQLQQLHNPTHAQMSAAAAAAASVGQLPM